MFRARSLTIATAVLLSLYGLALVSVLQLRPLWLDEIIQLIGTRYLPLSELLRYTANDPGQAPIGYLLQSAILNSFGYSIGNARILSAAASIVACFCMTRDSRFGLLTACFFALLPLQFRYAVEARPYALALLLAVAAILLALRVAQQPESRAAVGYTLVICLGILSQPYFVFVPVTLLLWAGISFGVRHRLTRQFAVSTGLMLLAYLPWYVLTRNVLVTPEMAGDIGWRTPLVVFKELAGGGYPLSLVLLACVVIVLRRRDMEKASKRMWLLLLIVPILGPLAADLIFRHFVANRQMIFAIPALAVFAASAIGSIRPTHWRAAAITTFCALLIVVNVNFLRKPTEDWQDAANLLAKEAPKQNTCIEFVPANTARYYLFFQPTLERSICHKPTPSTAGRILVAISPYGGPQRYAKVKTLLQTSGYREARPLSTGSPNIVEYR